MATTLKAEQLPPLIKGTLDGLAPMVKAQVEAHGKASLVEAEGDIGRGLGDDFIEFCGTSRARHPAESRAALMRVAARAIALLTLDEQVRGKEACEQDASRLDPQGYVKSPRQA